MVKVIKKEILTFPKTDTKKIITIAEKENRSIKQLIYYLSYLKGNREDNKRMINKKDYNLERKLAEKIETKLI